MKKMLSHPLLKNMAVYALTDGFSRAIPFLVMPILALYLTPSEFGIASNYMIFAQLIGAFIGINTYTYYSVEYYKTQEDKKASLLTNLIAINLVITLFSFIVIMFTNSYIESFFVITLQWQLLGGLMMFFTAVFDMFIIYLRMEEKVKLYGRYQIIRSLSSAGLSLLFVVGFLFSWEGRVSALVLSSFIVFGFSIFYFYKNKMIVFKIKKNLIVDALKFGVPLLPHKLSTWIRSGFDRVIITKNVGIYDTGLFSFGGNISNATSIFVSSFFGAYTPYVFKQLKVSEDDKSQEKRIKKSIVQHGYFASFGFGILLLISYLVLTAIVNYFFNESYKGAIVYFPYFFVGIFFNFIYSFFSTFIFYSKETKFMGLITIGIAISQASLTIPFINTFGTIGASYSLVIGSFLKAIIVAFYSQRVYPMPWFFNLKKAN